jgi:hypothetical protein
MAIRMLNESELSGEGRQLRVELAEQGERLIHDRLVFCQLEAPVYSVPLILAQ